MFYSPSPHCLSRIRFLALRGPAPRLMIAPSNKERTAMTSTRRECARPYPAQYAKYRRQFPAASYRGTSPSRPCSGARAWPGTPCPPCSASPRAQRWCPRSSAARKRIPRRGSCGRARSRASTSICAGSSLTTTHSSRAAPGGGAGPLRTAVGISRQCQRRN